MIVPTILTLVLCYMLRISNLFLALGIWLVIAFGYWSLFVRPTLCKVCNSKLIDWDSHTRICSNPSCDAKYSTGL